LILSNNGNDLKHFCDRHLQEVLGRIAHRSAKVLGVGQLRPLDRTPQGRFQQAY
jgi:hypothetical protein